MRRRYEITDREREVVQRYIPLYRKSQGGRAPKDRCQMLNIIAGCPQLTTTERDTKVFADPEDVISEILGLLGCHADSRDAIHTKNIQTMDPLRK